MRRSALALLAGLLLATPARAQQAAEPHGWDALRISKWLSLSATATAAVYGVSSVRSADRQYERLEQACLADPATCLQRAADGSYTNQQLERQYQDVRRRDRRARNALLASQVGVVASVVLFVLDLRHARGPADIPYQPPRGLRVGSRADGALELKVTW